MNDASNKAFCESCQKLVPAEPEERDGKIYLVKHCPDCGETDILISADARRYWDKRAIDVDYQYHGCTTQCPGCNHGRAIRFAFVNVTNRCNVNCPICFDNVPGLGFEFEPPMEYFDKLFRDLGSIQPKPTVCLFGGEPTVRKDLFDIVQLAKDYGLGVRIFTNGISMADEDYCRKLLDTRAHFLFSYDGPDPETYRQLRGSANVLRLKEKAIENIRRLKDHLRGRMTMVSVFAKGLNAHLLPDVLRFCHERRDIFDTIYLMPLVHAWDPDQWNYDPERITTEDVEQMVNDLFPEYDLQFLPLGFIHTMAAATRSIGKEVLPYGAHPNCESVYYLVSDGERFVPLAYFLKKTEHELGQEFLRLEETLKAREQRYETGWFGRALGAIGLRQAVLRMRGMLSILFFLRRHIHSGRLLKGRGPTKAWHALALPFALTFGRKSRRALARHTHMQGHIKLVVLPLEDNHVLETHRLERCPTLQTYLDPVTEKARFVPLCAWKLHNATILKQIADHYAERKAEPVTT